MKNRRKLKNRKLRAYRVMKGLTQAELASKAGLGLTQMSISDYELGKRTPLIYRQERIARVLGKKVTTLFPEKKRRGPKKKKRGPYRRKKSLSEFKKA